MSPANKGFLWRSAILIMFFTFASKILGFLRQGYVFYLYGKGSEAEAYATIIRITNVLRELIAEGALSAAFIAIFSVAIAREGKERAFKFANNIISISLIIVIILLVILYFTSSIYMPWLHKNEANLELTINLFNTLLPYVFILMLVSFSMGILNSTDSFGAPAIGPFFSNVAFLIFLFFTHDKLGVDALVFATVVGGLAYLGIQLPYLRKVGYSYRPFIWVKSPFLKQFLWTFIPIVLAMGIPKIIGLISNPLLTDESIEGSRGMNMLFMNANTSIQLVISVFITGVSTIALPNFSKLIEKKEYKEFNNLFTDGIIFMSLFTIPAMIAYWVIPYPLTSVVWRDIIFLVFGEKRTIDEAGIQQIVSFSVYLSPTLLIISLSVILNRVYQSVQKLFIPIIGGVVAVIAHWFLANYLVHTDLKFDGIALSNSIVLGISLIMLMIGYQRMIKSKLELSKLFLSFAKIVLASAIMGLCLFGLREWLFAKPLEMSLIWRIIVTGILIVAGMAAYAAMLFLLKEKEFISILKALLRRVGLAK